MFISPFWCGVIVTILIELGASVLGIAYIMHKDKENKDGKNNDDQSN